MTRIAGCFLGAVLLATAGCSTVSKSGASALEGKWNGREPGADPETPRTLVISGTHYDYHGANPNDWAKGTFTLREDTQPRQMLLLLSESGFPDYTGKTAYVIYKIEGDTLTAVSEEPGNPAPASFDAPNVRRMIFKRN